MRLVADFSNALEDKPKPRRLQIHPRSATLWRDITDARRSQQ